MKSDSIYQVIGIVDYEFESTYHTASTYKKALDWLIANVDGNRDFVYHDSFVITQVLVDSSIINEVVEFERVGYNWREPLGE